MGGITLVNDTGQGVPPERLCKLPVFRPVAVRLLSELAAEDVDVTLVTNLLNSDPAFSAEILTLANSSLYARQTRIDTVHRAIMCLGLERTRAFAATVALQGMVSSIKNKTVVQDCWQHSRATAIVAEYLAPFYRIHPEQAYTAALMHDIGRLGMLAAYPEYPVLLASAKGTAPEVLAQERATFSVNHCDAGFWLTRLWRLPDDFWSAAADHHNDITSAPGDRTDLVRLSCRFAETFGFRPARQCATTPIGSLIDLIPDTVVPRARYSTEGLAQRLQKQLQLEKEPQTLG
jgi:putative nucleotidyltransferase with HDIG domain